MNRIIFFVSIFVLSFSFAYADTQNSLSLDTKQIEKLTNAKGELDKDSNVFKVSASRTNLKVNAAGVKLTPALGLTSWASFKAIDSGVEVMGDLILFEDQISPVMQVALDNHLNIKGLHNFYLWDLPKMMVMHIEGKGSSKDLAVAIGKVFEKIKKTTNGTIWISAPPLINPDKSTLNSRNIEAILGKKGILKEGVYKIVWENPTATDWEQEEFFGRKTWAAFAGTDREAVMIGDIFLEENEVQNVLKTLLKHHIFVISLTQNNKEMKNMMCVHYMGRGPSIQLVKALKETLALLKPSEAAYLNKEND